MLNLLAETRGSRKLPEIGKINENKMQGQTFKNQILKKAVSCCLQRRNLPATTCSLSTNREVIFTLA